MNAPVGSVRVRCYAKLNLTLDVLGRRDDGYHDIDSIVTLIDPADELLISSPSPTGRAKGEGPGDASGVIAIETDDPGVPAGTGNLVHRAVEEFSRYIGVPVDVTCRLRKRIPMQAGLGGGSSDAAGALLGLDALLGTALPPESMMELASGVGSDVALFVSGSAVRMSGRGDLVRPLRDPPPMRFVVVKPYAAVSTSWAYAELDRRGIRSAKASERAQTAISRSDAAALVQAMSNDFDALVRGVFPEVDRAARDLVELGAARAMLAGSGSAVFGVFYSDEDASACASGLQGRYEKVMVARGLRQGEVVSQRLGSVEGDECLL